MRQKRQEVIEDMQTQASTCLLGRKRPVWRNMRNSTRDKPTCNCAIVMALHSCAAGGPAAEAERGAARPPEHGGAGAPQHAPQAQVLGYSSGRLPMLLCGHRAVRINV